ncbi:MAG: hypothetical protein H0U57_02165 [Tatlockia sp.]|nr:hypothetical protein [Tatlockia sp.]
MKFKLRSFEEIVKGTSKDNGYINNQDGFNNTKDKLSGKHNTENTSALKQPRKSQVEFVEQCVEFMATVDEKSLIITSLILLQMCVIGRSYSPSLLKLTESENIFQALEENSATRKGNLGSGSSYFNSLLINIGYSETNKLELEDVVELLTLAKGFIESKIYIDGDSSKGTIIDHPYSKIEQLDITLYLKTATTEIYESNIKIIDRNHLNHLSDLSTIEKNRLEEQRKALEAQKGPGFFSNVGQALLQLVKKDEMIGLTEEDIESKKNEFMTDIGEIEIDEDEKERSLSSSM